MRGCVGVCIRIFAYIYCISICKLLHSLYLLFERVQNSIDKNMFSWLTIYGAFEYYKENMLRGFFKFQADYTHSTVHEYGKKILSAAYFSTWKYCVRCILWGIKANNIRFAHTNGFSILSVEYDSNMFVSVACVYTNSSLCGEATTKIYSTKSWSFGT